MNRYEEFMNLINYGKGCDDCPLYSCGFCTSELEEHEDDCLSCGEILYRYLDGEEE